MPVSPLGAAPVAATAAASPGAGGFSVALRAHAATTAAPGPRAAPAHPALAALETLERAQARLDHILEAARAGRTFTAAELLGLQAEAYRWSQTVDLGAKLVEQGAQSVKQALNTPV